VIADPAAQAILDRIKAARARLTAAKRLETQNLKVYNRLVAEVADRKERTKTYAADVKAAAKVVAEAEKAAKDKGIEVPPQAGVAGD
jgi:hypothetical protein